MATANPNYTPAPKYNVDPTSDVPGPYTDSPTGKRNTAKLWNTGVRTGGKVVIYMDGYPIAFAQSARFRDDYGLEPVHVIGQLQTIEYVPMHARHEITISLLVLRNASLSKLGLEPASAGSFGLLRAGGGAGVLGDGFAAQDPPAKYYGKGVASAAADGTNDSLVDNGYATAVGEPSALLPSDIKTGTNLRTPMAGPNGEQDHNIWRVIHSKVFDIEVRDSEVRTQQDAEYAQAGISGRYAGTGEQLNYPVWPKTLLRYKDCFFAGGDVNVDANRVLMHNVTFYARDKDAIASALHS